MSNESKYPSEAADRFQVRLPDGMRDRIKAAAEANNRSMNAEIVAVLEEKYPAPIDPVGKEMFDRAMEIAPEEVTRFLNDLLHQKIADGSITFKDIEDGLIVGVGLRPKPATD